MQATILLDYEELSKEDQVSFEQQGISMDDWNFIVLAPVESIVFYAEKDSEGQPRGWVQQNWHLESIVEHGSYEGKWTKGTFRGKEYAIGVQYH